MAEVNKGTSGLTTAEKKKLEKERKKKEGKKNVGRPRLETATSVSTDIDDKTVCHMCDKVFIDDGDMLLECERCDEWFCTECLTMSAEVYKIMVDRKDIHWFCPECEKQAITAVKTDKDIEEKCAAYMSSMTNRLCEIDKKLDSKVDKSTVVNLEARVTKLEDRDKDKDKGATAGSQANTVRETIEEQREREARINSLIIQNLPESEQVEIEDRKKEDMESVQKLLSTIGIDGEDEIDKCVRIGPKVTDTIRITKFTVKNAKTKGQILKKAKTLKDNEQYENVYVGPDLTKMQRKEQYDLRKELKTRRKEGEKDIFISGNKIVRAKERALHFKGGAASADAASADAASSDKPE